MSDTKKGAAAKKGGGKSAAAGGKAAAAGERGGQAATNVTVKAGPAAASPAELPRLRKHYDEVVRKRLSDEFGYKNPMEVPKLERSSSTWALAKPPATRRSSTRPWPS